MLAVACTAAVLMAITGCSTQSAGTATATKTPGQPKALESITIAQPSHGLHILPLDVAVAKNFFQKEGITVKIVQVNGDAAAIPALISGSVQIAQDTSTPVLIADSKSPQLQMIADMAGPPAQIVMRKDVAQKAGITASSSLSKKVHALSGMTVAVNDIGGGLQYVLNGVLFKYGVDPSSVHIVAISPYTAALAALKSGRIDAIAPVSPYGSSAVQDGYGVNIADVFGGDVSDISSIPYSVLDANASWLKTHAAEANAVRKAIDDALKYIKSNPAGAAAVAKVNLPTLSTAVLEKSIKAGAYPADINFSKSEFDLAANFAGQSNPDAGGVSYKVGVWTGAQG